MGNLIIVESPTKARTIEQYLGGSYRVLSSQGHVRDLPRNELGVDVDRSFTPKFETKRGKHIQALRAAAREATTIYLATDHDREGEAIAYDLYTILRRVAPGEDRFLRPVFNEITKPVIEEALASPSGLDENRVEAQRTRRILDRLVGYSVSPLLSRVIAGSRFGGLSAGRVQSVALRLLCDREDEIGRFVPEEYWEIVVALRNGAPFEATVTKHRGEKISVGTAQAAGEVSDVLRASAPHVDAVTETTRRSQPPAPFITSSLQQTASSRLGFSPKRTMSIAQELYEGIALPEGRVGLITYMRTDSVRVSDEALGAAREIVETRFGKPYLVPKPKRHKNKRRSQDAHEAIRPTDVARDPQAIADHLSPDQRKLYDLIYRRFLATQMTPAVFAQRKAVISAGEYTLEAAGASLSFDGFLALFPEQIKEDVTLPEGLAEGQTLRVESVTPTQKFTEPPRRYSEAGLVNLLEKEGIGRPSTYASIVSVIQERGYAIRERSSLRPTLLGHVVVDFLKRFFEETVEPRFTAHMEEDLDQIEEGTLSRVDALNEFYGPFAERLRALEDALGDGDRLPFRILSDVTCDSCDVPMELRYWKGSHFLGCTNYPTCRSTINLPPDLPYRFDENGVLIVREALEAYQTVEESRDCPACGSPMEVRTGRFGRYHRCTNSECNATAPLSTGVSCPRCGEGTLIEKFSPKRRRAFYSCDRYPDCRFAVTERPLKACPVCGAGVLVEKGDAVRCSNKDCAHTEPKDGEVAAEGS
ncbi:MAG: type I DNA topoisomerase [Candidatus Bipolaricaulota bacterium]|nr:MAG: type I DNA topoisomerase [Candidatus Bipolaricaulota bacterium]